MFPMLFYPHKRGEVKKRIFHLPFNSSSLTVTKSFSPGLNAVAVKGKIFVSIRSILFPTLMFANDNHNYYKQIYTQLNLIKMYVMFE